MKTPDRNGFARLPGTGFAFRQQDSFQELDAIGHGSLSNDETVTIVDFEFSKPDAKEDCSLDADSTRRARLGE